MLECSVQGIDVFLSFLAGHCSVITTSHQLEDHSSSTVLKQVLWKAHHMEGPPLTAVVREGSRWHRRRTLQTSHIRLIAICSGKNSFWFWAFWFPESYVWKLAVVDITLTQHRTISHWFMTPWLWHKRSCHPQLFLWPFVSITGSVSYFYVVKK